MRRELAKLEVAKLHNHIRNQRKDYMHKVTSELVNDRAGIAVEKLSPKNMSAKGGAYKSGLNREILAAAAGQFHQMLGYKAEEAGCIILEVDPKIHKPSQTCSGGGVSKKKGLGERTHVLPDGTVISRDLNAARNLLALLLEHWDDIVRGLWDGNRSQHRGLSISVQTPVRNHVKASA